MRRVRYFRSPPRNSLSILVSYLVEKRRRFFFRCVVFLPSWEAEDTNYTTAKCGGGDATR
eukprot:scaffold1828_cov169-Amphora_coffeaeformis.AAC.21